MGSDFVRGCLSAMAEGKRLFFEDASDLFKEIMEGRATSAQIGAILMAIRLRGETIDEVCGAATAMKGASIKVPIDDLREGGEIIMDTCGTGGDHSGSFNVSTTIAFILAASDIKVAKHGNRSITSRSGSADCLEALGKDLSLSPQEVAREIREVGIGFLFAQNLHPAMRYAALPRRELGIRTIFNVLGPLTNPAGATHQLMGVFSKDMLKTLASVLGRLGAKRAWVVHGEGGLDELSIMGKSWIAEWDAEEKAIRHFEIVPEDAGLKRASLSDIRGGDAKKNASILVSILKGEETGAKMDMALLNAGAGMVVAGKAKDIREGVELARELIRTGKAFKVLNSYLDFRHK